VLPFLLLATRVEDEAADDEYAGMLRCAGLEEHQLHRVRLEAAPMPAIDLDRYAGVRAERIGRVMELVRHNAADHHLADGPAQRGRDEALRRQQSLATRAWLYGYDVEAMLSAALAGRAVRAT